MIVSAAAIATDATRTSTALVCRGLCIVGVEAFARMSSLNVTTAAAGDQCKLQEESLQEVNFGKTAVIYR